MHDKFCDLGTPCADPETNEEQPHQFNERGTRCLVCELTCFCPLVARIRSDERAKFGINE